MDSVRQVAEGPQPNPYDRLPAELRALPQWCVTPGTATEKAPRRADGQPAKVNEPSTWMDFDTACRVAAERNWRIGFVFTESDPFACIDLDWVDENTQRAKGQPIDPTKWTTQADLDAYTRIVAQPRRRRYDPADERNISYSAGQAFRRESSIRDPDNVITSQEQRLLAQRAKDAARERKAEADRRFRRALELGEALRVLGD